MKKIGDDRAPLGLVRFDAEAFADEIRNRFGDLNVDAEAPFIVEVYDFTGHRANWIMLECGWSVPEKALVELIHMAARQGLHVWGK